MAIATVRGLTPSGSPIGENSVMLATVRLIGLAVLLTASISGCGRSPAPEPSTKAGIETVTFHVTDMGKRLALM